MHSGKPGLLNDVDHLADLRPFFPDLPP